MTSSAELANLRVRMGIDSSEFTSGVRSVQNSLGSLSSSLKTFVTGAAAITLFRSAVASLHDVADMGDVAEAIGISAENLQVFNRLALASGTSTDVMARGLQSIAEQSTDANSALSKLFVANGLRTGGKEMNQIVLEFMTLLQNAKSPAEQLAIATGVLGTKVGRALVESLRAGASGWNEAFNSMVKDGIYLSDEQVKAAQAIETKYNEVLARLTTAWQKFVVLVSEGIGAAVNPDMGGGANKFRYNYGLGVAPGVPSNAGSASAAGGKGDLPGNMNPKNYQLNKATANPFSGISTPKASIVPLIPPGTIDDIYGAGDAVQALQETIVDTIPEASALDVAFQGIVDTIAGSLGDALVGIISGTESVKEAFAKMAQSISQQLAQIAAELAKSALLKVLSSAIGGSIGGGAGLNVGGMTFGGLYADGGNLGAGKWGIAGEAGPEIIHGPARITPMDKMGGSGNSVNIQIINNSSAQTRKQEDGNGNVRVIIEDVVSDMMIRGGNKIDAAMNRGYGLRRAGR